MKNIIKLFVISKKPYGIQIPQVLHLEMMSDIYLETLPLFQNAEK